jgi:hypothetical protein
VEGRWDEFGRWWLFFRDILYGLLFVLYVLGGGEENLHNGIELRKLSRNEDIIKYGG